MDKKYRYGYLPGLGGSGLWVIFPAGEDPDKTYIFGTPDADEARDYCARLNGRQT